MLRMFAIVVLTAGVVGCKSDTQRQLEAEAARVSTPLDLDPTERIELPQMWSNEHHILRLNRNASYAMLPARDPAARPVERGRWGQQSYAVLWLEPYETLRVEPRRVSITRIDGRLALLIPGHEAMFPVEDR